MNVGQRLDGYFYCLVAFKRFFGSTTFAPKRTPEQTPIPAWDDNREITRLLRRLGDMWLGYMPLSPRQKRERRLAASNLTGQWELFRFAFLQRASAKEELKFPRRGKRALAS